MILTVAPGSTGSYFVDEDGNVYTDTSWSVKPADHPWVQAGHALAPGQRPERGSHMTGPVTFWLPNGHNEHDRVFEGDEQMADAYERIRVARAARDEFIARVCEAYVALEAAEELVDEASRDYLATLR